MNSKSYYYVLSKAPKMGDLHLGVKITGNDWEIIIYQMAMDPRYRVCGSYTPEEFLKNKKRIGLFEERKLGWLVDLVNRCVNDQSAVMDELRKMMVDNKFPGGDNLEEVFNR